MLKLGECNQLLVTDPFTDDGVKVSSRSNHDTLIFGSSGHHPLRTRPVSPERCSASIPSDTIVDSQNGTRPMLTRMLNLNGASTEGASAEVASAPQDDSDIIIHSVGPNDSFAGVALRYGISIAALRRANQLWPSDPIHLRTELLIPRRGILPPRHKSPRHASTGASLVPTVEPNSNPGLSPDLVASSFVAARNMILSVLPARLSLESLSSKASASEDHELDDLRASSASDPPFAEEGHELSVLTTPHTQHKLPALPLLSQILPSPTNHQYADIHHIPPINDLRLRSLSSSRGVSLERLPRMQPFAVRPVRTSQLEPEPAMELPVRFSAFNNHYLQADSARRKQLPFNRPRSLRYG